MQTRRDTRGFNIIVCSVDTHGMHTSLFTTCLEMENAHSCQDVPFYTDEKLHNDQGKFNYTMGSQAGLGVKQEETVWQNRIQEGMRKLETN